METTVITEGRTEEAVEYLINLDLEQPWASLRKAAAGQPLRVTEDGGGFVNDGSLVCFTDGIAARKKQDILSSLLLAQLAANKMVGRLQSPSAWLQEFLHILRMTGWVFDDMDFTVFEPQERTVMLQQLLMSEFGKVATPAETEVLGSSMEALKLLKNNDRRLVLFDTQTQSLGKGNFQVSTVTTRGNEVVINLGAFIFSAMSTRTRMLWHNYNTRHTEIWFNIRTAVIDEAHFAEVRPMISAKLGDSLDIYTGNLNA